MLQVLLIAVGGLVGLWFICRSVVIEIELVISMCDPNVWYRPRLDSCQSGMTGQSSIHSPAPMMQNDSA